MREFKTFPHLMTGIFLLCVSVLSFFTAIEYPGNLAMYIIFTFLLNSLLILGFTKDRIFFDTFIGLFFWLGYWLKFSVKVAFFAGKFHEPVGNFNGTAAAYDHALLVTSCGVAALLAASLIRRKFFFSYRNVASKPRFENLCLFYRNHRSAILIFFCLFVAAIGLTNVVYGFYQRGSVPRTFLPLRLNGVYTWLLLFGLASVSAVILDFEFRYKKNPYLVSVIALFECFVSNMSMLSRGMILNGSALMIGVSDDSNKRSIRSGLLYKFVIILLFGIMFLLSVLSVNHLRRYVYTYNDISLMTVTADSVGYTASTSWLLFVDRWVGMEGIMAVTSYPHLGWDLWRKAWQERFSNYGTSMYDREFIISPYMKMDWSKHHFVGVPGILAFFYYPGSLPFLLVSMLFLGFFGAGMEFLVYRLGGANVILCALLAQVVASRYAHFGYAPNQSYLLFSTLIINSLMIFSLEKALSHSNKVKAVIKRWRDFISRYDHAIAASIGFLLLLPLFFQLKGGIFSSTAMVFDSKGLIGRLPIPISVAACLIGIVALVRYRCARPALALVSSSFLLMAITSLFNSGGLNSDRFVTLVQFLLPMTALVLGQLYERLDKKMHVLCWTFFAVVSVVIFLQLYSSWELGYTMLVPYLFLPFPYTPFPYWPYPDVRGFPLFSIYQHLQYVPVVLTGAFLITMFGLRGQGLLTRWIWVVLPVMALYIVVSSSVIAMFLFLTGIIIYAILYLDRKRIMSLRFALVSILIITAASWYLYSYRGQHMLAEKLQVFNGSQISDTKVPGIVKRMQYWQYYGTGVTSEGRTFLVGTARPADRKLHSSAHNYYLDFVYHFGFLSFIPLLVLIVATVGGVWRRRKEIIGTPALTGLALVVLYLLFVENMLKVGLRQPYPGIFAFFLWGILMSKLSLFEPKEPR